MTLHIRNLPIPSVGKLSEELNINAKLFILELSSTYEDLVKLSKPVIKHFVCLPKIQSWLLLRQCYHKLIYHNN